MSEYQWVEFRAVDRPLDEAALDFMHQQSTRADIDRWSFSNEYQFGNFRGDVLEMMRQGYDVHVHYTNFGLRRICFRIPDGFSHVRELEHYLLEYEIEWMPDNEGTGGVVSLQPDGDAGSWDWMEDVESLASDMVPLREMIIAGDFRPLYIAHIAFNFDEDALEPPVPAGLQTEHHALDRLCDFYEVDCDLITVAAEASADPGPAESDSALVLIWVKRQPKAKLAAHLQRCLTEPKRFPAALLREVRAESQAPTKVESGQRTIGELRRSAAKIDAERTRQRDAHRAQEEELRRAKAEQAMQKKLAEISANPEKTLRRIDLAIDERNRTAYRRAAAELSLLAKACGNSVAAAKGAAIRAKYPSRSALKSELKKAGF